MIVQISQLLLSFFFFQAEDGIRDLTVTGVQTCALPICVAGVASWMALNPVEREDYRRFGCLEAEIGNAGIVRRLVWRIKSGDESRVLGMAGGDIGAITLQHIFDAARAGDGVSIS